MNKTRRNELSKIIDRIEALDIAAFQQKVADIASDLERLRDEEQDAFDNLPQSLQDGEKGSDMQAAIDSLTSALENLEQFGDIADDMPAETVSHIDDARGQA